MKRIVFMGTPEFSSVILEYLHKNSLEVNASVIAAYCQPDKPAGRGNKLQAPAVKQKAEELGIEVYQPLNFKSQEDIDMLAALKPDVLVVAAYGLILPESVLSIPSHGAYNVHASLLPQWRGAAPIQRGLLAGDKHTGITIMRMEKGLDTGDMLIQQAIKIENNDTSQSLFDSLADIGAKLMLSALKQIFELRAAFIKQNHELATYAQKILKEEYILDWNVSAIEVDRKVRALLTPRAELETKKGLITAQILQGKVVDFQKEASLKAGSILKAEKDCLIIACKDNDKAYAIEKIKPNGKSVMQVKDFVNGYV